MNVRLRGQPTLNAPFLIIMMTRTVLTWPVELGHPLSHHPQAPLLEFGGMDIGAMDLIRLLMRK
ncbi:hypothetical protein AC628_01205 [Bradyrhizobium sp. NAS96.2]|nr:hypothetical protein AC628_01205 [Bradyrhizobium sp. NAS96.2]